MGKRQGYFITVEGGEGVGKSSFVAALSEALAARGIDVLTSFEPGGTALGQGIRGLFLNPPPGPAMQPLTELLLVSAARVEHLAQKIRPALAEGRWVLCDRFADSARVYQGSLGGVPDATVESIITETTGGTTPDVTFLLACPVETIMGRIAQRRGEKTRFDGADVAYHERLQQAFGGLAQRFPARVEVLDARLPLADVVAEALRRLQKRQGFP